MLYGMPYGMSDMSHTFSPGYLTTGFNITSPMYAQSIDIQVTTLHRLSSHLNLKQA